MIVPMRCYHPNTLLHLAMMFLATWSAACTTLSSAQPETPPAQQPSQTIGSCALNLPPTSTDEDAIRALLAAEGELVVKQDIVLLMQLWNDGAHITDAKNTAFDPTDDQQWLDKDAIRHRYVRTVFPGAPTVAMPKDLSIVFDGQQATITATTQIGNEISPAGDRWVLSKQGDCWGIESLTYNLESSIN